MRIVEGIKRVALNAKINAHAVVSVFADAWLPLRMAIATRMSGTLATAMIVKEMPAIEGSAMDHTFTPAAESDDAMYIQRLAGWLSILLPLVSIYLIVLAAMKAYRIKCAQDIAANRIQSAIRAKMVAIEAGKALMLCRLIHHIRAWDRQRVQREIEANTLQDISAAAVGVVKKLAHGEDEHRTDSKILLLQSKQRAVQLRQAFLKQRSAAVRLQAQVRGATVRAWFAPVANSMSLLKKIASTPRRASVASKLVTITQPTTAATGWNDRISCTPSTSGSASPTGTSAPSPETGLWLARIEQSVSRVEDILKSQSAGTQLRRRAMPSPPSLPQALPSSELLQLPLKPDKQHSSQFSVHSELHNALILQLKAQLSTRQSSIDNCDDEPLVV